ncbi:zinc finger RNA-binding protein 2 isoform X2 [Ascaphus truei]|uniref:zinc finger RNA-binding protein 2 isoform X2 n=1 Tax=Ascaphus truei TaxID=8439 RepID=UPI003F59A549
MAASNYYGYPHGGAAGPQYSSQPGSNYSHPSPVPSYSVQQPVAAAHSVTPTYSTSAQNIRPVAPAGYGGHQTYSGGDYNYGTRQQEPPAQPAVNHNYQDNYSYGHSSTGSSFEGKQFYQAPGVQTQHSGPDTYYQGGGREQQSGRAWNATTVEANSGSKSYTQPSAAFSQAQRPISTVKPTQVTTSTASSYGSYPPTVTTIQPTAPSPSSSLSYAPISSYNSASTSYSGSSYSSYETSTYSEPGSYYHTQPHTQQPKPSGAPSWGKAGTSTNGASYTKKPQYPNKQLKPKGPPKQPQLHYCDICKISCAGSQTYKEHLDGQKHKKKEAALKTGAPSQPGPRGAQTQLHCELCDVSCTGADAYAAHIRGAKHQKVVKLHTKLGKPIPSIEPVLINSAPSSSTVPTKPPAPPPPARLTPAPPSCSPKPAPLRKLAPSRIPLMGGPPLRPTPPRQEVRAPLPKPALQSEVMTQEDSGDGLCGIDVQPVGHDYVEEVRNDEGKMVRFHCKLCECSFNDPNAKDMHLKGRRHRLQYKKKVNPQLPVEVKPSNRARKLQEEKLRRQQEQREAMQRHLEEQKRWHVERRRYEEEMYWRQLEEEEHMFWEHQHRRRMAPDWTPPPLMGRPSGPVPPLMASPPQVLRRPDSLDDRYIMCKHAHIYPSEEELQAVQKAVSLTERALKLVSDCLEEDQEEGKDKGKPAATRLLRGVMRVGILAKGLLLRGDCNVHLILLCSDKPSRSLLQRIAELLPEKLATLTEEEHEVSHDLDEAKLTITSCKEPKVQLTVSITCPMMREEAVEEDGEKDGAKAAPEPTPDNLLSKEKCTESLNCLRQAKWFQAQANGLQSCVIIIRIFRDLCQRVPTWGALPEWTLELLVEKTLSSVSSPLSPGDAMRRVLECIATGILLTDGPGLQDPCEKEQLDVLELMTNQQREDVTASAQHALRMLAFRQIHKVLGMDPLPSPKNRLNIRSRKRRREASDTTTDGEGDGKKDKKGEAAKQ